jgi:hypothetical protein
LIAVLFLSFGVGAKLLRLIGLFHWAKFTQKKCPYSLTEEFAFATALGLGLISYLVLLLGLLGLFYVWAMWGLLLLLALVGGKDLLRLLRGLSEGLKKGLKVKNSYASGALGVWLFLMGGLVLLGALAPAGGFEWDGLAYHLAIPKIYLQQHHIGPLPWMSHSNFPLSLEMLYGLGLALKGQILAKLFHFGCGFLLILAVYAWGNAAFGRGSGLLAAALLASVPLFFWEATIAYNELAFALFCFLSIWAWWKSSREDTKSWVMLSGIFAGLALATKMLAGFLIIFILLALLWQKLSKKAAPENTPGTALLAGIWLLPAILIAAPWYIKSYLWTGNPVYPFFYSLFDGKYWSQVLAGQYSAAQAVFGMGHGLQWLLASPWTLTMYGYRFYDQPESMRLFNLLFTVIGPIFLIFLPAIIWRARQETILRFLLAYCGIALLVWFLLTQQNRYLLPILPPLALAAAGVMTWLAKVNNWSTTIMRILIGLELALGLATAVILVGPQLPPVLSLESNEEYLAHTLDIYPISEEINRELPAQAKILLLNETRGFYLDRQYLWGPGHNNLIPPQETKSPEALLAAMRQLDITHILLSKDTLQALRVGRDDLDVSLSQLISQGQLAPALDDQEKRGFVVLSLTQNRR